MFVRTQNSASRTYLLIVENERVEGRIRQRVLHRLGRLDQLVASGSDRAPEKWKQDYAIADAERLALHHLYRAMAWLGESLSIEEQAGATPWAPRTTKDLIEEELFGRRCDLFTTLDLVFFDTTSIYFEGEGGETLGQYGKSKDHRSDRKQMVVGLVLDNDGSPVSSEMWPGNASDLKALVPVVERLKRRFRIGEICIVADGGMISAPAIEGVEQREWNYILGVRMRQSKDAREEALSRPGRYEGVRPARSHGKDPASLKVKQVEVAGRRYIVCRNPNRVAQDRLDRTGLLAVPLQQLLRRPIPQVRHHREVLHRASIGKQFALLLPNPESYIA